MGEVEAVRETGLVVLNDATTLLRECSSRRLVVLSNTTTTLLPLIKFLINGKYNQKVILLVVEQQAFTYETLEGEEYDKSTVQRVIKFLLKMRLIRLWGWKFNAGAPHSKIYLVDGGDESRAQALKRGRVKVE